MTPAPSSDAEDAVAVIADIVGSRALNDRQGAQQDVLAAFSAAQQQVPALLDAWPTVGDEFQTLHATWADASRATLRVALALPEGLELRFGLGRGSHQRVGDSDLAGGLILDGTAWHRAREAVEEAEARASGLSTAFRGPDPEATLAVDGMLRLRDHIVRRLKARERRIAAGLLAGSTQAEVAAAERISQAAVSQAASRSGIRELLGLDARLAADASMGARS